MEHAERYSLNSTNVQLISDKQGAANADMLGWLPGFFPEHCPTDLGDGTDMIRFNGNSKFVVYQQYGTMLLVRVYFH